MFFLFYAKIAVFRVKLRRTTKNGAKNKTTAKRSDTAHLADMCLFKIVFRLDL